MPIIATAISSLVREDSAATSEKSMRRLLIRYWLAITNPSMGASFASWASSTADRPCAAVNGPMIRRLGGVSRGCRVAERQLDIAVEKHRRHNAAVDFSSPA